MPQLGVCKALGGFHLKRSFDIPEFRLLVAELVHDKTSAKYWHLKRDDSNKTFSIQFRTTPFNNTGVSHILEHTVLCGSGKYPVRDPFFKMLHRSQANFMNALTASDWTMYPFSTMNDADFRNLLSVYSDAVFNPKLTEFDFMQEGWRLEPEKLMEPSTKLLVKGVVFNEMKGVFSNALNRFGQTVQNNLLPRTYGYVSGGHPQSIPKLTWGELKQFHRSYYHPSNANIYSYGDVNLEWCLEYLNKEYLQNYTLLELENHVPLEPVWDAPRTVDLKCESDPMAPDPDRQCVVSLSYRLEDIRNIYTNFVLGLVSKLLLSGDNAPLYHGLIESGFALDWAGSVYGMDQEARTTSFHVGVQGVRADQVSEFSERVNTILQKVLSDGFPLERVEALLHQYELAMRHESARFGLHLIFALAHAVNHNADVKEVLEVQNMVRRFRADLQANPSLLLDLMQRYLLDNKHVLLTTMRPDENWLVEESTRDAQLHEGIVAGLSSTERDSWVAKSRELLMKQQQQEDISCLPCLRLLDISSDGRREPFTLTQVNGCPVQLNEAPTNGVFYFHALADLKTLSSDLLIYVPLFCELFPRLGAEELSYLEMDQAIELNTGGLSVSPHVTPAVHTDVTHGPSTDDALLGVHLSGYCLEDKLPKFFELWTKLFRSPTWSDRQRLMTLILMSASGDWSANAMADSAHRFAMIRAAANLAPSCRLHELWNGLEQALLIKKVASCLGAEGSEAEAAVHELTQRMLAIWKHIADSKRLKFSLHGESDGLSAGLNSLGHFVSGLSTSLPDPRSGENSHPLSGLQKIAPNSYFVMPYSVHYVGQAFPAPSYESPNYAAFRVLSHLLTSKFLHREIREKGGAYGGRAVAKPLSLLFYSYRDPHAGQTLGTFEQSLHWALSTDFNTQDVDEAKLATFQELDQPVSAGSRGLTHFLHGISDDLRQQHRNHLFVVDNEALHSAANQLVNQLSISGRAVLGPEDSQDVPTTTDLHGSWERVVMNQ